MWNIDIYPFAEILSKEESDDNTILIVDISGGLGHAAAKINSRIKNVPGRVILQDQSIVIDAITTPIPGVECMKYDFSTPQTIKGTLQPRPVTMAFPLCRVEVQI